MIFNSLEITVHLSSQLAFERSMHFCLDFCSVELIGVIDMIEVISKQTTKKELNYKNRLNFTIVLFKYSLFKKQQ